MILALDSTAVVASVALCRDETPIAAFTVKNGNTHSETLLPMVESVLKTAGYTVNDVDLFACSVGPGSFTGVRIGVSVLKGLASGKDTPCVGVSTLEALAENLPYTDAILCPVMDARRNQVYTALFKRTSQGLVRLTPDRLITLSELSKELASYSEKIYLCGDGYEIAKSRLSVQTEHTPTLLIPQNAVSVAAIAERIYEASPNVDYSEGKLQPIYLRASQAERERLEKEANKENNT